MHYDLNPSDYSIQPIEAGHINDSYHLRSNTPSNQDFFLQKINTHIFSSPAKLMHNIETTIQTINSLEHPQFHTLKLVSSRSHSNYIKLSNAEVFRMYHFLEGYASLQENLDSTAISLSASAFSFFTASLQRLDIKDYYNLLPDFHNLRKRLKLLQVAVESASDVRLESTKDLLTFIDKFSPSLLPIQDQLDAGNIPYRITHNDTKSSNIMLHPTTSRICIIDLDTVMPSSLLFDFGDGIRGIISTKSEDADISEKTDINLELIDAFSYGYSSHISSLINEVEKEYLALSVVLLPFLMGVRFLTDYLENDHYFKISYSEQNHKRAKNQLQLAKNVHNQLKNIHKVVRKHFH